MNIQNVVSIEEKMEKGLMERLNRQIEQVEKEIQFDQQFLETLLKLKEKMENK